MAEDRLFPNVSKSVWATIIAAVTISAILLAMSMQGIYAGEAGIPKKAAGAHPIFMYVVSWIVFVLVMVNTTNFPAYREVFGFKGPYPGFNVMLAIMGGGLGMAFFGLVARPAMLAFKGNSFAMSMVQPLYIPFTTTPYMLGFSLSLISVVMIAALAGVFEELYKILIFKNLANWISEKWNTMKDYPDLTYGISFMISTFLWWAFHFTAGPSYVTVASLVSMMIYSVIFWSTFLLPDILGIISPEDVVDWRSIGISGAITMHITWDVLIGAKAMIGVSSFVLGVIGLGVFAGGLIGLWVLSRYHLTEYKGSPTAG